ncbi:MAG: hypothetical protein JW712_07610 [Dehalococcoidales bacterium]|nr:hypothetical protein [Dehalococcoidales bacterium]
MAGVIVLIVILVLLIIVFVPSIRVIGPTEIGLVRKRFGKRLPSDNPVAFKGEAGYQAELIYPGWRFKLWIPYSIEKYPWVQIPAGEIGVVYSQVGNALPVGAKSAKYHEKLGNFSDITVFVENGGEKGIQRPTLPPGTLAPYHPLGFLIITKSQVYGKPISPELIKEARSNKGILSCHAFGIESDRLNVTVIKPERPENLDQKFLNLVDSRIAREKSIVDTVGIITTLEGDPLPAGDIASRLEGFGDIGVLERDSKKTDSDLIEVIVGTKNDKHNNYQDFQKFLDADGRIGLQHDPLLYGAYNLNPILISVEKVPMLVVEQGEVAVIKAYIGEVTEDTSGSEFKYGTLVRPGHKGIWREPLRTGKFTVNPRLYQAEIVPTAIVTLNWAKEVSEAHGLDKRLSSISAKSKEGFVFTIDLQVLIHISDTKAPRVISMVGTVQNLVDEVLQSAVGNYFRDTIQSMPAVEFIERRQEVQVQAEKFIREKLANYDVETLGVYIQDVVFPEALVKVLNDREIANQLKATYQKQEEAEQQRISMEERKGTADKQKDLASAKVDVEIKKNLAEARKNEADGEAYYTRETGKAEGEKEKAIGEGKAAGYEAQVRAIGENGTTLVNVADTLGKNNVKIVPDVMVSGGGGTLDGIAGMFMQKFTLENKKVDGKDNPVATADTETTGEE